jgi:hypothetical protein
MSDGVVVGSDISLKATDRNLANSHYHRAASNSHSYPSESGVKQGTAEPGEEAIGQLPTGIVEEIKASYFGKFEDSTFQETVRYFWGN